MNREEREAAMGVLSAWNAIEAAFAIETVQREVVVKHVALLVLAMRARVDILARFATSEATDHPSPCCTSLATAVLREALAAGRTFVDGDVTVYDDQAVRQWLQLALAAAEAAPGVPLPPARRP